ncbi:MAG: hypothetical protein Q4G67_15735 [Actinomycetia bacterium]|nr:hypothetical protein [Actinomycetes bacterium]
MKRLEKHPDDLLRSRNDLIAAEVSVADLRARVRNGDLIRLRSGLYATGDYRDLFPEDAHRVDTYAAHRVHPISPASRTVYSHESAAALHGLTLLDHSDLKVRRTRDSHPCRSTSTTVTMTSWLPLREGETTAIDGIPVTTVPRTIADLLRTAPRDVAICAADAALRRGSCTREDLAGALSEPPSRYGVQRGTRRLVQVNGLAESALETRSRLLFADAGIPEPELQVWFDTQLGRFRVDFFWRDHRVIGECDGMRKYVDRSDTRKPWQIIADEKDRENELQSLGYVIIRWRWRDLSRPEVLFARLRRALFGSPVARSA